MGLKIGIIGLANVGKSTLFNAILGRQQALTAPYPFATVEPNIGVVDVPDERLIKLRNSMFPASGIILKGYSLKDHPFLEQPPLVFATVTFVDIAGLVKGAAAGQGLGNQFLAHIRDVDLILHVLRDFDEGIPRAADSKNPEYDAEIVRMELELKDLEVAERKSKGSDPSALTKGSDPFALAKKPVIYAVNVGEDKITSLDLENIETPAEGSPLPWATSTRRGVAPAGFGRSSDILSSSSKMSGSSENAENRLAGKKVFIFCAKIEEQISQLSKNEQKEYLKIYGLKGSCLDRIIAECFHALGLISFFTAPLSASGGGVKEVRAWPVRRGSPAPVAAGIIHSDFEKLFIRAEVINWEKLAEAGSWQKAKDRGWVRTEGKEHIIQDGEVVNFLIGVSK